MPRLEEFSAVGITATTISRMERAGQIVRLACYINQPLDLS